jgi:hypothetical protein
MASGTGIRLRCSSGAVFESSVVVGADGVHSQTRQWVTGGDEPVCSGTSGFRGLVPAERLPHLPDPGALQLWMGPGAHLATFAGWHPAVTEMIGAVPQSPRWGLFARRPLASWSRGHVVLLGDAAHAMLPHLGQGANQAIEDAAALARLPDSLAWIHGYDVLAGNGEAIPTAATRTPGRYQSRSLRGLIRQVRQRGLRRESRALPSHLQAMPLSNSARLAHDGTHLAGDLDVLAGADHQAADWGVRCPDLPVPGLGRVARTVAAHAEEPEPVHGPGPDLGGVLSDAAGEHERIQPAERCRHLRHRSTEPVQVHLPGEHGPLVAGRGAGQDLAHVGRAG